MISVGDVVAHREFEDALYCRVLGCDSGVVEVEVLLDTSRFLEFRMCCGFIACYPRNVLRVVVGEELDQLRMRLFEQ